MERTFMIGGKPEVYKETKFPSILWVNLFYVVTKVPDKVPKFVITCF